MIVKNCDDLDYIWAKGIVVSNQVKISNVPKGIEANGSGNEVLTQN